MQTPIADDEDAEKLQQRQTGQAPANSHRADHDIGSVRGQVAIPARADEDSRAHRGVDAASRHPAGEKIATGKMSGPHDSRVGARAAAGAAEVKLLG